MIYVTGEYYEHCCHYVQWKSIQSRIICDICPSVKSNCIFLLYRYVLTNVNVFITTKSKRFLFKCLRHGPGNDWILFVMRVTIFVKCIACFNNQSIGNVTVLYRRAPCNIQKTRTFKNKQIWFRATPLKAVNIVKYRTRYSIGHIKTEIF